MEEMSLRELTEALTLRDQIKRENEKNFRDIFFLNPLVMIITKLDGTIVKINEAYTKMIEYTKDESYNHTVMELNLYENPGERKEVVTAIVDNGCIINRQVNFRSKSGRIIPCTMNSKIICIQGEKHILSVIADDSWRICT